MVAYDLIYGKLEHSLSNVTTSTQLLYDAPQTRTWTLHSRSLRRSLQPVEKMAQSTLGMPARVQRRVRPSKAIQTGSTALYILLMGASWHPALMIGQCESGAQRQASSFELWKDTHATLRVVHIHRTERGSCQAQLTTRYGYGMQRTNV